MDWVHMKWEHELALAEEAARKAGSLLRVAMRREKQVLSEEGRDIKLQADRDAEGLILEILKSSGYGVLAEESGEHGTLTGGQPFWVVDPLDGTMNFSRGIPFCCVSIALCQGEDPLLGVIYDFNLNDCYTGIVGEGAWWNDAPMTVSKTKDAAKAVLTAGFPVGFVYDEAGMQGLFSMVQRFKKVRMMGSAALSLAYVACGRADAYAEDDIMLWDIAGGVALVKAAGGYVHVEPSPTKAWARRVRCASCATLWTA
jgi:myo-inositol-1(or 4)-monophosphatase